MHNIHAATCAVACCTRHAALRTVHSIAPGVNQQHATQQQGPVPSHAPFDNGVWLEFWKHSAECKITNSTWALVAYVHSPLLKRIDVDNYTIIWLEILKAGEWYSACYISLNLCQYMQPLVALCRKLMRAEIPLRILCDYRGKRYRHLYIHLTARHTHT